MSFTRDTALSAFVLACLALGVYLTMRALLSRRRGAGGAEWIATVSVGLGIITATVLARPAQFADALRFQVENTSGPIAVFVALTALAIGLAVGDYVFGRLIPSVVGIMARRMPGDESAASPLALPVLTVVSGVIGITAITIGFNIIDPSVEGRIGTTTGLDVALIAEHELPGEPRDLVFINSRSGFISFSNSITYFEILGQIEENRIEFTDRTPSGEIVNPRGLALAQGFLFVSEQGDRDEDAPDGMYSANGSVIRFVVGLSGELSNKQVLIEEIPIAGDLHGINGMTGGPDGLIYVSIGGRNSKEAPETPNAEWLGTILRFDVDGENVEIFARGFRNVYDLEFDALGRLWGVDNDGPTLRDYRAEEVIQIKEGAHYGFPFEGTFGTYRIRTDSPVWAFTGHDVEGTAGIELAENLDIGSGLFVGARVLHLFRFSDGAEGLYSSGEFDRQGDEVIFSRQGYFTIVEASDDGLLFAGVTGLSLQSNLYILRIDN